MIPTFGRLRRPIAAEPLRFPLARPGSTVGWLVACIGAHRRDHVLIDAPTGLLQVWYGRHVLVTVLHNVAAAAVAGPARASGELVLGGGGASSVRVRFHRAVRGPDGAGHHRVRLTVEDADDLVRHLR